MHYNDRRFAIGADLMPSSNEDVTSLNVRHSIGSNFTCNMLVQPTAAIFRPSNTNRHYYQHNFDRNYRNNQFTNQQNHFFYSQSQRSLLANDVQEIMKNRLLSNTKSSLINMANNNNNNKSFLSSINSNERLTLPTINVEDEAQVRAFDNMLNNAQLTSNLTTINEQYEQLLTHLLNPYYSPIPASMLLLNNRAAAAAALEPQQHQNILPSHVSSVSCKSIPHADNPVNLEGFRAKRPIDWSMEDVWSWMVAFAEQRKISADYLNMANFVNCTGMKLLTLSRQQFVEMDETYGQALYEEFKKLAEGDYAAFDDVIRSSSGFPLNRRKSPMAGHSSALCSPMAGAGHSSTATPPYCSSSLRASNSSLNDETRAATSDDRAARPSSAVMAAAAAAALCRPSTAAAAAAAAAAISQFLPMNRRRDGLYGGQQDIGHSDQPSTSADQRFQAAFGGLLAAAHQQQQAASQLHVGAALGQHPSPFSRDSVIKTAGCDSGPIAVPGFNPHVSSALQRKLKFKQAQQSSASFLNHLAGRAPSPMSKFAYGKICKKPKPNCTNPNDDMIIMTANGKPRKRSQHTKGNKLWEFIRDALKDPETCPSIVKWEDQEQGVFRIVESERLARLWGRKKNNSKMTYEKLSRAMRTYYEKKILEPVPKTGLYPKKLVYKFGPCAHGWQLAASAAHSSSSMMMMPPVVNPVSLILPPTDGPTSSSSTGASGPTFNELLMAAVVNNGASMPPPLTACNNAATPAAVTATESTPSVENAESSRLNYEMAAALLFSQINAAAAVQQAASPQQRNGFLTATDFYSRNEDVEVEKRATPATAPSGHQVVVDVKQEMMEEDQEEEGEEDGISRSRKEAFST